MVTQNERHRETVAGRGDAEGQHKQHTSPGATRSGGAGLLILLFIDVLTQGLLFLIIVLLIILNGGALLTNPPRSREANSNCAD